MHKQCTPSLQIQVCQRHTSLLPPLPRVCTVAAVVVGMEVEEQQQPHSLVVLVLLVVGEELVVEVLLLMVVLLVILICGVWYHGGSCHGGHRLGGGSVFSDGDDIGGHVIYSSDRWWKLFWLSVDIAVGAIGVLYTAKLQTTQLQW